MESRGKTRLIRISVWVAVLSLLLAVVSSLATALAASAHTSLTSMTPASGSTATTTAPTQVVLTFTEPVSTSFAAVTVTDSRGATATAGRATVSGATVTQPLRPLRDGSYAVVYRVVSADGHAVSGRGSFSVQLDEASATEPASPSPSGTSATAPATPAAPSGTPSPSASLTRGFTPQPAVPWALTGVIAAVLIGGIVALGSGRSRRR